MLILMILIPVAVLSFPTAASGSVHTEFVEYMAGSTPLQGYIAYDDSNDQPRPGVIIVHEWWGLGERQRQVAERIAQLGYVGFAIDMYGKGKLTDSIAQAAEWSGEMKNNPSLAIERFQAALDLFKANPLVDTSRIAAIGYCFGGTVCLEMARAGLDLDGVVSFHGGLESVIPDEKKNIKARILVLTGGDDPNVPPEQVIAFEDEMRKAGADWEVNSYGGAVHSFTNPDADSHGIPGVKYNAKADKRSWEAMKSFFAELFAK
jgi:dienelactone hydrolase